MAITTSLSALHQTSVRKLLAEGKDPVTIRAIFKAVPERAGQAAAACAFAESFTPIELDVLADQRMDDLLASIERRRSQRILADQKRQQIREAQVMEVASVEGPKPEAEETPAKSKRRTIEGHPITAIIRWCGANGFAKDRVPFVLDSYLDGDAIHPSTLAIQWTKGTRNEGIPELDTKLAKHLKSLKKQAK